MLFRSVQYRLNIMWSLLDFLLRRYRLSAVLAQSSTASRRFDLWMTLLLGPLRQLRVTHRAADGLRHMLGVE